MKRFAFIIFMILATCVLRFTPTIMAQPYPNRPIQLINISPPGG